MIIQQIIKCSACIRQSLFEKGFRLAFCNDSNPCETEERNRAFTMNILVVDDEKLIVKGLKFSLEQDGMQVECAYDGEEALECARKNSYDMILLDIMLPKMDGMEVCQQIREFSDVPIIMLTAKGEDMDKILGLEYGADDYITKPFNI